MQESSFDVFQNPIAKPQTSFSHNNLRFIPPIEEIKMIWPDFLFFMSGSTSWVTLAVPNTFVWKRFCICSIETDSNVPNCPMAALLTEKWRKQECFAWVQSSYRRSLQTRDKLVGCNPWSYGESSTPEVANSWTKNHFVSNIVLYKYVSDTDNYSVFPMNTGKLC